ncbi:MAG: TauD/TfdA family dioxygenase [Acidimicrobiia bacterium]|nr:TauD/TfdA family dioxygenase [Acidimicrobiia bacterium]MDH5519044.1 TauD/TfdA family dioxygenase [Acidimicrobiia bacterium]
MTRPAPATVPTPDFYHYRWIPLSTASIDGDFVKLTWGDGSSLSAYSWWLRESIVADGATDPTTREGTIDPADFDDSLSITGVQLNAAGALLVGFSDGFAGTLHPGWLHHVATGRHRPEAVIPAAAIWTAEQLAAPPTFDGAAVLAGDGDELLSFLEAMVIHGLARLSDVPARLSEPGNREIEGLVAVTDLIGVRRDTNFGPVWSVKAEISGDFENSTANTGLRLGPHADLPTREIPPGFQFLHCVANTVGGGWSRMTDGAALVAHLEAEEPDTYDALTSLDWVFFNRSRDHDHRWVGPMIDHGAPGSPLTIRAFYPVRGFPAMDPDDIPRAYRAAKRFHQLGADPRFQIGYPFRPGDLVGFDNRRMLHGRDAFDPGGGTRHLRGTYVDHDEVYSRIRVLARAHTPNSQEVGP